MSTQTLSITYSAGQQFPDPYWIRLDQDAVSDAATVTQTADVLDALFNVAVCNQNVTDDPEAIAAVIHPVEQSAATEVIAEAIDLPACGMDQDGSITTELRVYRSHLAEPYVIRLQGGTATQTVQESGTVEVAMEIADTVTLDYPVVSAFLCTPVPLSRVGNTLRFDPSLTDRIFKAVYQSQWDLVTVRVDGVAGEPGACRALAFHHGVASALELQLPEIAEIDRSLCPTSRWDLNPTDYEVTCYKDVLVTQRCSCSSQEVGTRTEQQVVPCPNPDMRCPNNQTRCMHLLGTETVTEWVDCPGDSEIPGIPGSSYELSTPAFYREVCCKEPDVTLPQCPVKRTTYKAELPIELGQAYWRGLYGEATRFVPVPPAGGICGEWIIEQSLTSGCCTEIQEPEWDTDKSVEVLSDHSEGTVYWSASMAPYTVRLDGSGFYLAGGKKVQTVTNEHVTIYTTTACGTCKVIIEDACEHTVEGSVRSVNGQWVQVQQVVNTLALPCAAVNYGTWGYSCYNETIVGGYKVRKRAYGCMVTCGGVASPASFSCANQPTRPSSCAPYGTAGITTNRPTVGHDPGDCTGTPDCRQVFLDGQIAYCNHEILHPGKDWTVWEWQC